MDIECIIEDPSVESIVDGEADVVATFDDIVITNSYSVLNTASYSSSTLTIELSSKPKLVIVTLRRGNIMSDGRFAYATLNPETNTYVSAIQTNVVGSTVAWTDVSSYATWDDTTNTFSMKVRGGSTMSGYCTYHAVG